MISYDKIKNEVALAVFETITSCKDLKKLFNQYIELKEEISQREDKFENVYHLHCELELLKLMMS